MSLRVVCRHLAVEELREQTNKLLASFKEESGQSTASCNTKGAVLLTNPAWPNPLYIYVYIYICLCVYACIFIYTHCITITS